MKGRRTTTLGQLRPKASLESELAWFFNQAACDMGDQSNYLAMLGARGPGSRVPSPEEAVPAAHGARRIRGWLLAMSPSDAGVLQCAYRLRPWPEALWDEVGRLVGVVVRLASAEPWMADDGRALEIAEARCASRLAAQCPHSPLDATFHRLRREAEGRLSRAQLAYRAVREADPRGKGVA